MSTSPIQVVHSDTTITYNEPQDKWEFTLRGRDRSADSLEKAREIIDKPVPKDKAKPFEKIPAWLFEHSDNPSKIEVTGIAEGRGYGIGDAFVWINKKGTRSKQSVQHYVYPRSEKNDAIVQEIISKRNQIAQLRDEIYKLQNKLAPLVLPKDE